MKFKDYLIENNNEVITEWKNDRIQVGDKFVKLVDDSLYRIFDIKDNIVILRSGNKEIREKISQLKKRFLNLTQRDIKL